MGVKEEGGVCCGTPNAPAAAFVAHVTCASQQDSPMLQSTHKRGVRAVTHAE